VSKLADKRVEVHDVVACHVGSCSIGGTTGRGTGKLRRAMWFSIVGWACLACVLGDSKMRGWEANMGHGPSREYVPVTLGSVHRLQARVCRCKVHAGTWQRMYVCMDTQAACMGATRITPKQGG
jgi:hypothetical protein